MKFAGNVDLNFVVFNIPSILIENINGKSSYKGVNMLVWVTRSIVYFRRRRTHRKSWISGGPNSRRLTICKHSCVRHISWAFCSAISGKQTMFTKHKASAMEADNNSQLMQ